VAIPNEKADLRAQHMRLVSEIKALETSLTQGREEVVACERRLKELDATFQASDKELAAEIKAREREKARVEKEVDALEIAKVNPYQQIGRVLADSNLAPMNQPHALEKVKRQRFTLHELEYERALSLQQSGEVDPILLRMSYMLWGVMVFAAALFLALLVQ
jgi:septal ring factor EnvC (AmiA/AmiB activator)